MYVCEELLCFFLCSVHYIGYFFHVIVHVCGVHCTCRHVCTAVMD